MFAGRHTKEVTITDEDGTTIVTIRRLSDASLETARDIKQQQAIKGLAVMAGINMSPTVQEEVGKAAKAKAEKDAKADSREAIYAQYDRATVLRAGIKSWTADVDLASGVGDLDSKTATILHREILDLSVEDPAKADKAEGKG